MGSGWGSGPAKESCDGGEGDLGLGGGSIAREGRGRLRSGCGWGREGRREGEVKEALLPDLLEDEGSFTGTKSFGEGFSLDALESEKILEGVSLSSAV